MTHPTRRGLLGAAAALALGLAGSATGALAQEAYPDKPITMLVGYGAGGQTDLIARAAANVMSKELGQPINVVNKPGAGGAVAAKELQAAAPDGYTVMFHSNSVINSAPFIMERVEFTHEDFDYAGMLTFFQVGLVTQKDAPYDNLQEFIAWAKENPGFSYGSLSPEARMYMEAIAKKEGIDANIVPLKSGGDMINGILGRQFVLAFSGGIHNKYPDEMKMISALTTIRHPSDPDVLTIEEDGFPLGMDTRTTLILPKGTPRPILEKLSAAMQAAETDEDFNKVVAAAGIPIMYMDLDEAAEEMESSYAKNKSVIESVGVVAK
ncbi:tripartite tricarboxylate transporter substrate binding protein [Microbaculum marinum]|uniref:Tripartite tricarboxylate transporter substrate binding protein n=1 Tax=Microbaculum marinum TaxID=1764581 RepID=A0AAW9RIK6_9HYPH